MALGYAPTVREALDWYGGRYGDVAGALCRAARGKSVQFMDWPTPCDYFEGEGPIVKTPRALVNSVQRHLQITLPGCVPEDVPPRYPGLHGRIGQDVVLEVDDKRSHHAAFEAGKRIRDFLEGYGAPYRVKFSGNSSLHFILPQEIYEPFLSVKGRNSAFLPLFNGLFERLADRVPGRLDSGFSEEDHTLRLPYSLNERTGLVSLPIHAEDLEGFTSEAAEIPNVRVEEWWFDRDDLHAQREGVQRLLREVLDETLLLSSD